jgi:transposase
LQNVAADFGVGISTVSDWVKSKSKLEEHLSKMPNGGTLQPKTVVKKNSN